MSTKAERDDPVIFAGDRLVAGAVLQAWPPMTEVICPILVDMGLSPGERSAAIDAVIGPDQRSFHGTLELLVKSAPAAGVDSVASIAFVEHVQQALHELFGNPALRSGHLRGSQRPRAAGLLDRARDDLLGGFVWSTVTRSGVGPGG